MSKLNNRVVVSDNNNYWVRSINETLVKDFDSGLSRVVSTIAINKASYMLPAGAMVKSQYTIGELTKLISGGVQLRFDEVFADE